MRNIKSKPFRIAALVLIYSAALCLVAEAAYKIVSIAVTSY